MRKILQITPVYAPSIGGVEDVVRSLARELNSSGWKCDVADVRASYSSLEYGKTDLGCTYRVPLYGHRLVGLAPALRSLIAEYDLIHVHDPQLAALSLNVLLWSGKKPKVLSTHGGFFHTSKYSRLKLLHANLTAPRIANAYNEILASSESDFVRFSLMSTRVEHVSNGVNVERFGDVKPVSAPDYLSWIYWGRFSTNKRLDCVIRYASFARSQGYPVKLRICGSDFDGIESSLKTLIEDCKLSEHVDIVPTPTDQQLLALVQESTVFITASEFEGFGLSVVEAMAAGLPVICRDIEPLNSFIKSDLQGVALLFDESPADFARLTKFISSPLAAYREGSTLNRSAATEYSWKSAVDGFVNVYERLLQ